MDDYDDEDTDDDVFHFETEHLALRGNQSYTSLLRTIAMLQAQRIRVHQQIEELEQARNLYLEHPQLLLEKLRNNEPIIAPNYLTTVSLPELPMLAVPEQQHVKLEGAPMPPLAADQDKDTQRNGAKPQMRLWTNEEQRRLEQLLIEYPPEEIEMRRFAKIAKALGNRTPQQVFSRVQKYFQKLHDAGMPVPGRLPKYRRAGGVARPKFNVRRSTFFPAQNIEISMPEDDYVFDDLAPAPTPSTPPPTAVKLEPKQEPDTLDTESRRKKQLQLKMLTALRQEKQLIEDGYSPDPLAPRCADCEESAVTRDRWRCNSCYCFINLCGDCLADQLIGERFEHMTHDVVVEQEL
ncbi:hypothetical protein KR222_002456 [Zaprionus bogoriensis]|nr:hypothetical protein KR222_002456 [Zaprionus bogoriensis]